jgi:hypothetical protein
MGERQTDIQRWGEGEETDRETEREGGRERGREGGREGGRETGREGSDSDEIGQVRWSIPCCARNESSSQKC